MTTDPFDRLRALNPVPTPGDLQDSSHDANAMELLDWVLGEGAGDTLSRHRRRRIFISGVVAAVLATAAAAWVITRPAGDPTQVACYGEVNLRADIVGVEPAVGDATAACARVWETGEFSGGTPPPLEACVLESGIVGVFPARGGDPCGRLGLDRARSSKEEPAIVVVQRRLTDRLGASCVPIDDALDLVAAELHRAGLDGWTVQPPPETIEDRPCASVGIDAATQTVTVVGIPQLPAD